MSADGAPDAGFGDRSRLLVDLGGPTDAFSGVTVTADGNHALVAGWKGMDPVAGDAVLARMAL